MTVKGPWSRSHWSLLSTEKGREGPTHDNHRRYDKMQSVIPESQHLNIQDTPTWNRSRYNRILTLVPARADARNLPVPDVIPQRGSSAEFIVAEPEALDSER